MNLAISNGYGKYTLFTNEGLQLGDKVFPMVSGYRHDGKFYVTDLDITGRKPSDVEALTGWPNDPHTVESFYTDSDGLQCVATDKGYSPEAVYFKVVPNEDKDSRHAGHSRAAKQDCCQARCGCRKASQGGCQGSHKESQG